MAKIKQIRARQILSGKGEPTIETTVILSDGRFGIASVPSAGAGGNYEAVELRDKDSEVFQGRGVLKAIANITDIIAPALLDMDATKQQEIDKKMIELDGTSNKARLGANAILSVSIAVCKAAAQSSTLPLFLYLREYIKKENLVLKTPAPIFNLLNGNKEDGADFKDFSVFTASSKNYSDSLIIISRVYESLKETLRTNGLSTLVSDKGGFSPKVSSNEYALGLIKQGVETANLRLGFDLFTGVDVCANNFYKDGKYKIKDKASTLSSSELSLYYQEICKNYNVLYLEDPFADEDLEGWSQFASNFSADTLVVGDNLTATNLYRLQMALDKKAITGMVIKPLQIGTVIESLAAVEVARAAGLKIIVSSRSHETNDDFIADFAVAVSSDYTRFGSIARGEMVSKYNRLSDIEKQLKSLEVK
ncbi:MAG TPA: phosphopyruvate hydratase [Patescibacteria group bacterium]|nr:phosphopyruvate hydratase [Patescibacteria group bacterium]